MERKREGREEGSEGGETDTVARERAAVEYKPLSFWLQLDFSSSPHTQ